MIPDSEIVERPKYEVKSEIENIFLDKKILDECSVNIY